MILKCNTCFKYFDDQFRDTSCPHDTFSANDGKNNFKHYSESWLNDHYPLIGFQDPNYQNTMKSEYNHYQEWLNNNKVRIGNEC